MPGQVQRFEDLIAWQRARSLCAEIYQFTRRPGVRRDFGYSSQIQRAAVSTMSNIAEGYERRGLGEFHQLLTVAKASCGEVRSLLYVALDVGYLTQDEFEILRSHAEESSRVITGLRASVAKQRQQPAR